MDDVFPSVQMGNRDKGKNSRRKEGGGPCAAWGGGHGMGCMLLCDCLCGFTSLHANRCLQTRDAKQWLKQQVTAVCLGSNVREKFINTTHSNTQYVCEEKVRHKEARK